MKYESEPRSDTNPTFPLHYFSFPVIIILNDVFYRLCLFCVHFPVFEYSIKSFSYYFCLLFMLAGKKQLVIHKIMYFISWHSLLRTVLISASINDSDITAPNWHAVSDTNTNSTKQVDWLLRILHNHRNLHSPHIQFEYCRHSLG